MKRLIFILLAALLLSSAASALDPRQSAKAYVKSFYDAYVPGRGKTALSEERALVDKRFAFSSELASALKADRVASSQNDNEIVGLDFDPFLNSQDVSDAFVPGNVNVRGTSYLVDVFAVNGGKKNARPEVVAEVKQVSGRWTFVNFIYGHTGHPEDDDLVSMLKDLKKKRGGK